MTQSLLDYAKSRLKELDTERDDILKRFPELEPRIGARPTRRVMSAEARAKIGAATRARWAARKAKRR